MCVCVCLCVCVCECVESVSETYRHTHTYRTSIHNHQLPTPPKQDSSLIVFHPYRCLIEYASDAGVTERSVLPLAWNVVNDSLKTNAPLIFPPYLTALGECAVSELCFVLFCFALLLFCFPLALVSRIRFSIKLVIVTKLCFALLCFALPYFALPCFALLFFALPYFALPCFALLYPWNCFTHPFALPLALVSPNHSFHRINHGCYFSRTTNGINFGGH